MKKITSLLFFLMFFPVLLIAQDKTIVFRKSDKALLIGESVYVYEDKTAELSWEDIRKPDKQTVFRLYNKSILNFGSSASAYWIKFTVSNQSPEDCFLEIPNASIEKIDIYIPDEKGNYSTLKTGFVYPFSQREYPVNTFQSKIIPAGNSQNHTIYLRVHSALTLLLPLRLGSGKVISGLQQHNNLINGIYLGLVIITLVFNIFTWFFTRRKIYLYYGGYLLFFGMVNMSYLTGYTLQYFGDWFSVFYYYMSIPVAIGYIFLINFTVEVLDTRHSVPGFHKVFYFFWAAFVFIVLFGLFRQWQVVNLISETAFGLIAFYLLAIGIVCYIKGEKQASLYTIAIAFFLAGALVTLFVILDWLPFNFYTRNALTIGSSVEIVLLSFTLTEKVRQINTARKDAEATVLKMVEEEKIKLERLVQERTEEITAQNEEITAQNEEIITQNEELSVIQEELTTHRDQLFLQNEQLKDAQTLIEEYNQKLEMEVARRTDDLQKSNETLVQYNRQLEQFAFITAHNLRSPVARILGLGSLMELPDIDLQETLGIIEKLVISTRQLDEIIKDLNNILAIRKTANTELIYISLEEEVSKLKALFEKEIAIHEIEITTNFSEIERIKSVPAFLSSILYNLINNAVKYRHPERTLRIHIKSEFKPGFICISVTDNGLGIDLARYREKLFMPYQRFHLHIEGKGLGLYLVKTQTETLHGKIDVESTPDEGSTFFIYLLTQL